MSRFREAAEVFNVEEGPEEPEEDGVVVEEGEAVLDLDGMSVVEDFGGSGSPRRGLMTRFAEGKDTSMRRSYTVYIMLAYTRHSEEKKKNLSHAGAESEYVLPRSA